MAINIYVDQGHNPGTINAGASGNGIIESEVTYWVGIYLAGFLYADPRFAVRVARPFPDTVVGEDTSSSLRTRVEATNLWPADYFISIHVNSNPSPALNGSEVYVYRANSAAADLAAEVLASIVELVGTRYNMVRLNPSLYVLRATVMPAILVELGYLTNLSDAEKLKNDQYLFAFAIYIGILNYFGFDYADFPNR